MLLNWQGDVYSGLAVSKTNPPPTPGTSLGAFGGSPREAPAGFPMKGAPREVSHKLRDALKSLTSRKAGVAELAYSRDGAGAADTYYASIAQIWQGPLTITSHKYNLKYRTGVYMYTCRGLVPGKTSGQHEMCKVWAFTQHCS